MIEWYGTGGHTADCGDLTLETFGSGFTFRAVVLVNGEPLLDGFDYPTLDAAKLAAETFAREWVAKQAAALGDGWVRVGERLPEHHKEVLVASVHGMTFQAVGMWHGEADGIFKDEPGWYVWNRPFTYKPDFVTHWRPLPPLPVAEVEG